MRGKQRLPYVCLPVRRQSFWDPNQPDNLRTALREAAYIRRTKFEKNDVLHDFSSRSEDLFMMTPIIPAGAPDWVSRPFLRWQLADEAVQRPGTSESVRAWHVCADLPVGLSRGTVVDQAEQIVRSALPTNAVAEICGHMPDDNVPHVHILVAARAPAARHYGAEIENLEARLTVELQRSWLSWLGRTDSYARERAAA